MNKINSVIIFLIILVAAAILLRIAGVFDFTSVEVLSAILMLVGVAAVYSSFGTLKKGLIFVGTATFFVGILVFINAHFELETTRLILFPSVLLIMGSGFLLLYVDEPSDKLYLTLGLIFLGTGIAYVLFVRSSAFSGFFVSFWNLIKSYWIILVLAGGLILLLRKS